MNPYRIEAGPVVPSPIVDRQELRAFAFKCIAGFFLVGACYAPFINYFCK